MNYDLRLTSYRFPLMNNNLPLTTYHLPFLLTFASKICLEVLSDISYKEDFFQTQKNIFVFLLLVD